MEIRPWIFAHRVYLIIHFGHPNIDRHPNTYKYPWHVLGKSTLLPAIVAILISLQTNSSDPSMTAMKFQHVKSYIGFKWMFPKTCGSSYRWILVAYQFLSRAHFGVMSIHVSRFVHFKYLFFNILSTHPSMDWLKGKPRGNHRFSHEVWGFPVIFPLDQSIEFLSPLLSLKKHQHVGSFVGEAFAHPPAKLLRAILCHC